MIGSVIIVAHDDLDRIHTYTSQVDEPADPAGFQSAMDEAVYTLRRTAERDGHHVHAVTVTIAERDYQLD